MKRIPINSRHAVNTTYMDVGSADIAYVHGWTVVGQCICAWLKIAPCIFHTPHIHVGRMDGSRTTQERLSRSSEAVCRGENICHPCTLDTRILAADGDEFMGILFMYLDS